MSINNGFEPYWLDEKDWLVEVIMLPSDEDCTPDLEYIGKLFAFSNFTNTRMLAQVGDPDMPIYELWFSFTNEANKQKFLEFVREDGYANPDDETTLKPPSSLNDLTELRPLSHVFPKEDLDQITTVALVTTQALETDANERN